MATHARILAWREPHGQYERQINSHSLAICLYTILSTRRSVDSPPQSRYKTALSARGCFLFCFHNITHLLPTLHPWALDVSFSSLQEHYQQTSLVVQ